MSAPMMLCAAAEVAANRLLGVDEGALAGCGQLAGRRLAIELDAPAWTFCVEFHAGGVRVAPACEEVADASVRGGALALARAALQAARGGSLLAGEVRIEGDADLVSRCARLFARADFDLEEVLARWLGDAPAHRVTGSLRGLFDWTQRAGRTLAQDAAEYLTEETGDLARGADVEDWMAEVDDLRDAVARVEARLRHLEQRMASTSGPAEHSA